MGKGIRLTWSPTSVGGTIAESMTSWPQIVNGSVTLNHIFLKSSRPDTTFDFKMTSPTGNDVFVRTGNVGELNEGKDLVMKGLYILTLSNVKNGLGTIMDDTFSGEFMVTELKNK